MSKRRLLQLVNEKIVESWNDPRMPTIAAFRRRGYTPESIRTFCDKIGVQKRENLIELGLLEYCVREDLNKTALRRLAVLDPVKLVITNYPDGEVEHLEGENNPEAEDGGGSRLLPFSKELWIEREDFMEEAAKKYFRLAPGLLVRLKYAYIVKCTGYKKDENGVVTEVYAEYLPESKSGKEGSAMSVKGTIHWVSVQHALTAEVRLYDRLFKVENPASEEGDFKDFINPDSLHVLSNVYIEPELKNARFVDRYQFLRKGYFCLDESTSEERLVFNRTVTLKDTWAKEVKRNK